MKSQIHSWFSSGSWWLKGAFKGLNQYAKEDQRNLMIRINGRNRNFVTLILGYCILLQIFQLFTRQFNPVFEWGIFDILAMVELCLFAFGVKSYFFRYHLSNYHLERRLNYCILLMVTIGVSYFSGIELVTKHTILNYFIIALLLPMSFLLTLKEMLLMQAIALISNAALFLFFQIPTYLMLELLIISLVGTINTQVSFYAYVNQYLNEKKLSLMNEKLVVIKNRLEIISQTDELTKLKNRYGLSSYLIRLFDQKMPQKLAAILLDVDSFKSYNDYYGHIAGDDCLRQLASYLKQNSPYVVARYGGEEFIIIVENEEDEVVKNIACSIRKDIENLDIPIYYDNTAVSTKITISIGVVNGYFSDERSMLTKADHAMYQAKRQGRNCTVIQP